MGSKSSIREPKPKLLTNPKFWAECSLCLEESASCRNFWKVQNFADYRPGPFGRGFKAFPFPMVSEFPGVQWQRIRRESSIRGPPTEISGGRYPLVTNFGRGPLMHFLVHFEQKRSISSLDENFQSKIGRKNL